MIWAVEHLTGDIKLTVTDVDVVLKKGETSNLFLIYKLINITY